MPEITTDICIIGGGAGGVSVASGAAQLGRKVVLVERHAMGGTCLNAGCVPANALIAAARAAEARRTGSEFGLAAIEPRVDGAKLHDHIRGAILAAEQHDSQARLESLGVKVIRESARFIDRKSIEAGPTKIVARNFIIATGSRPIVPEVKGLDSVSYVTTETMFEKEFLPEKLIVLGGGSTGLELAQAYGRLGAKVTVIDTGRMLAQYDRKLAQILFDKLRREGIVLREGARISHVEAKGAGVRIEIARVQGSETIEGSHILVATGRKPNIESLDLSKARIQTNERGIKVDERLRTTNRRVYAIGDAAGAPHYTHVAGWHAGLILRSLVLKRSVHASHDSVPTVLHTDPEIASLGLNPTEIAKKKRIPYDLVTTTLDDTDRGQTDRVGESLVELVVGKKGRVLGVSMVAPGASELILPWNLVISEAIPLENLADLVVPYPTLGEHMKRATATYYGRALFSRRSALTTGILARLR
jgi:pyruvate/2-oxoglutarate dehydrogenase complex dihydrolipoamide dehydrogenase (E3) component